MLTTKWPVTPLAEHKYTPLSSLCADGMSRIPVEGRKGERGGGGRREILYGIMSLTEIVTSTHKKTHISTHDSSPESFPQARTHLSLSMCT